MTTGGLIPAGMNAETLGAVLLDIHQHVVLGDSFEGSIEYVMPHPILPGEDENLWPSTEADFWVTAAYRIGNRDGQGGMRLIGTVRGMNSGAPTEEGKHEG